MNKNKLLVFCVDALCDSDIPAMRDLPHFGALLSQGALARHVSPVYPSFTYPCHVSILTGTYPDRHGVAHNEMVRRGSLGAPWHTRREDIRGALLPEIAHDAGLSTCSLHWPVSAGMRVDLNLPMIVPYHYTGYAPEQYLRGIGPEVDRLVEEYFWKYGTLIKGTGRSLDLLTMAVAPDILRDFGQSDLMLVKMCDLDSARHAHGVHSEQAREELRRHDDQLGVLMECVRRYGDFDRTTFVVLGDHGQSDVDHVVNLNVILKHRGLLDVDETGALRGYTALAHSVGLSCWVEINERATEAERARADDTLRAICADARYGIGHLFTAREAAERFRLTGPFDYVLEGGAPVSFSSTLAGDAETAPAARGDYKTAPASHGNLPGPLQMTTFFACGPAARKGAVVDCANMVDEAPTMAAMLGLAMPEADGRVLSELLA